eukprot:358569_1
MQTLNIAVTGLGSITIDTALNKDTIMSIKEKIQTVFLQQTNLKFSNKSTDTYNNITLFRFKPISPFIMKQIEQNCSANNIFPFINTNKGLFDELATKNDIDAVLNNYNIKDKDKLFC